MKIIVLHGDDTTKSYARLTKFLDTAKSRQWDVVSNQFPNTPSLFGTDRLIVYSDYKLLTKNDIKNADRFEGALVIYHDGVLPAAFLKLLPADFKMEKFELPKILFVFLEAFYPGNIDRCVTLFHELIKNQAPELIFFMLARHLRDLYWVTVDPQSSQFPSWRAGKLKQQAGKFEVDQLTKLISKLSDIDIKVKTTNTNLVSQLDLLMVKELQ